VKFAGPPHPTAKTETKKHKNINLPIEKLLVLKNALNNYGSELNKKSPITRLLLSQRKLCFSI
jgi:hypothetical protein